MRNSRRLRLSVKGHVMDIQPFSVNDGDGIRTTIFLAGCPLRCQWCSNPEGFSCRQLVGWHSRKCIGCGECAAVCPEGLGIDLGKDRYAADDRSAFEKNAPEKSAAEMHKDKCTACGKCVSVCPVGARVFMSRMMHADEVLEQIQKHRLFYMQSGGGITFSGGEATAQPQFLRYLAEKIYNMGYDMAIETSGYFDFDSEDGDDLRWVFSHMDTIFMDLKLFDDEKHLRYTGVSNEKILGNIEKLGSLNSRTAGVHVPVNSMNGAEIDSVTGPKTDPKIVIRIPVIGGVNDDDENIRQSAAFVREKLPHARMELLPYHELGRIKYEAIGLAYDRPHFSRPTKERMEHLRSIVTAEGVDLADYR